MRRTYFWFSSREGVYFFGHFSNVSKNVFIKHLQRWSKQDKLTYWSIENVPSHVLNRVRGFDYEKEDLS